MRLEKHLTGAIGEHKSKVVVGNVCKGNEGRLHAALCSKQVDDFSDHFPGFGNFEKDYGSWRGGKFEMDMLIHGVLKRWLGYPTQFAAFRFVVPPTVFGTMQNECE